MRHMYRQTNTHGDSYIPSKTLFAGILKKKEKVSHSKPKYLHGKVRCRLCNICDGKNSKSSRLCKQSGTDSQLLYSQVDLFIGCRGTIWLPCFNL